MKRRRRKTYLDWAATSYPKPESVYRAGDDFARRIGIGNDRGSYEEGVAAGGVMERTRRGVASLINADPSRILLTSGATESLNTLLLGLLRSGDQVLTSPFEHNSVRRPLEFLRRERDVEVGLLPATLEDGLDPAAVEAALTPKTRLVVLNWISNSFGLVLPVAAIGKILKNRPDIIFAVDAAQALGTLPVDVEAAGIDFLAFSGHKGLLGPTGTGGFYVRPGAEEMILPLKFGGTGLRSAEEIFLTELPHKYEVGTQNTWGLAGLAAGVEFVLDRTVEAVHEHIAGLVRKAAEGLGAIEGVVRHLPGVGLPHGLVSFNFDGLAARDGAVLLDRVYSLKIRDGLHCSPDSHRLIGTLPGGTLRASFGIFTSSEDVEYFLEAVAETAEAVRHG